MSLDAEQDTENEAFLLAALEWQLECGVDGLVLDEPLDKTNLPMPELPKPQEQNSSALSLATAAAQAAPVMSLGASEAKEKAQNIVKDVTTLEQLKEAIEKFEDISLQKTATNTVFADGNAEGHIMVIGDKPNADSDRDGRPFVGAQGVLLDKILASIGLSRAEDAYLTTLCNWRPPGDRSLNPGEIAACTPFILKHIELIKPKYLILLGDDTGKTILESELTVSKLRGKFHDYKGIKVLVTYHPETLLKTPLRKKHVWHDMLKLKAELAG